MKNIFNLTTLYMIPFCAGRAQSSLSENDTDTARKIRRILQRAKIDLSLYSDDTLSSQTEEVILNDEAIRRIEIPELALQPNDEDTHEVDQYRKIMGRLFLLEKGEEHHFHDIFHGPGNSYLVEKANGAILAMKSSIEECGILNPIVAVTADPLMIHCIIEQMLAEEGHGDYSTLLQEGQFVKINFEEGNLHVERFAA